MTQLQLLSFFERQALRGGEAKLCVGGALAVAVHSHRAETDEGSKGGAELAARKAEWQANFKNLACSSSRRCIFPITGTGEPE